MPQRDCLIIGGGPAGLTAALYLARFRRTAVAVDGGKSRAAWIPTARNLAGWPEGVSGPDFLTRARGQAESFGARIVSGFVEALERAPDGGFEARLSDGSALSAEMVILAAGVAEAEPPIAGFEDGVRRGAVRLCPICDGFEAQDRRVAVLGAGGHGAAEALFLRTWAKAVVLFTAPEGLSEGDRVRLAAAGVAVRPARLEAVGIEADGVRLGGERFDTLYSALGVLPCNALADQLGARRDAEGRLVVGPRQETSVEGLYAAGDLVRGLNQISVAMAEAAIAATAVHNRLPPRYA